MQPDIAYAAWSGRMGGLMFRDKERLYQIYHSLLSMALSWALSLTISHYFELRIPIFLTALFSLLPVISIYLIHLGRRNAITYLVIVSIIPILALMFWVRNFNPIDWIGDYMTWIARYDGSAELHRAGFSNFTGFLSGFLGALLFFLLTKSQLSKIILAVALVGGMILLSVGKVDIHKAVVGICVFYVLSILVECYGIIYTRKARKQEKKESILYLAPVCLLLAILSIAMPSKPEPIKWTIFRNAFRNVREQIEGWSYDLNYYFSKQPTEFFISLTGYSEDGGELSSENGELLKDDKVAMRFTGSAENEGIYLIGSVSDIYTGYSWEKSGEAYLPGESDYRLDYTELIYALSRQERSELENNRFIERATLKLQYNSIKTRTFFYPLKMKSFVLQPKTKEPASELPGITFEKPKGRGTSYEDSFYEMNLRGEAFIRMLRASDTFSYDRAPEINQDSLDWLLSNFLSRDYAQNLISGEDFHELFGRRAELIREKYTGVPQELPSRVRELAQEITAGSDTDYDKLKAIEQYLRTYTYSLAPQAPPEGSDFTDYFLFEGKEGYCTSYATAMAVLGRCVGIPTRYVEGFVAKFEHRGEDNMYPIRNSQAHAWAEAYFEGVGWIPFEATTPFYEMRYGRWADPQKESSGMGSYPGHYEGELEKSGDAPPEGVMLPDLEEKEKINEVAAGLLISVGGVLILVLLLAAYYYILAYRYRKRYDRADDSMRMYLSFLRVLELLRREGFVLGPQETISMLAGRVKDHFRYDQIIFRDVANVFMRYRYGEEATTQEELEMVVAYRDGLARRNREKQPKLKRWMEEFAFLMKMRNV